MSVTATRFVWELDLTQEKKRSTKRLVLLAIADRANNDGICFPSIARVVKDTCLDRKTVMQTLTDLIEMGVIKDTGAKKGSTNQVRVLQINLDYQVKKHSTYTPITPVHNSESSENKQYQISQLTVPFFPSNSTKFPCNSTKFGTQNLKQSKIESKKEPYTKSDVKKEDENCLNTTTQSPIVLTETELLLLEEQAHLEGKTVQELMDSCVPQSSSVPTTKTVPQRVADTTPVTQKKWIPRDEYIAMKKQERSLERSTNTKQQTQNKEMCVSAAMQESFKQGFGNPNATKGIPEHVLANMPKWMRDKVLKQSK